LKKRVNRYFDVGLPATEVALQDQHAYTKFLEQSVKECSFRLRSAT